MPVQGAQMNRIYWRKVPGLLVIGFWWKRYPRGPLRVLDACWMVLWDNMDDWRTFVVLHGLRPIMWRVRR